MLADISTVQFYITKQHLNPTSLCFRNGEMLLCEKLYREVSTSTFILSACVSEPEGGNVTGTSKLTVDSVSGMHIPVSLYANDTSA